MKKFLSIILTILMIVTMIPMAVLPASASTPTPYDGVPVTPQKISSGNYAKLGLTSSNWSQFNGYYAIRNAKELYGFAAVTRSSSTANAVLLQDIVVNANGGTTYNWTPIAHQSNRHAYEGIFDGNGHYISGLYSTTAITRPGMNYSDCGFICNLYGTVKNLVIKNSTFAPGIDIGVNGGLGAITGYPYGCTIQNCRVENITLKSINDGGQLGGIAGYGNGGSSTIKNCVSINVTFSGGKYTNSIAPKAPYSSCYTSATASHNCTNLSVEHKEVKATCEYPGLSNYKYCLVCGKVTSGTKTETPATGHTLKSATCVAPKTCTICGATEGSIDNTAHSWANNDGICANGCGATCAHKNQTGSACEICGAELHVCRNYDNGFCTECDAYQPATLVTNENYESFYLKADYVGYYAISNAGQLFWYANYINTVDRTANAVLTEDIDLENRPWTPIGSTGENSNNFRGIFDGQNYIIRGLYVEGDRAGLGFFGEVRTGTVKNFTIYGEVVVNTEVDYVGGVIGSICGVNGENDLERNGAIIQNIKSFVNLTVKAHGVGKIGGFVGYANHQSLIEKCSWYGTFDAGEYRVDNGAGGFIGRIQENSSEVTIRNCGAYGTIKTNYAGDYNDTATIYMGGFLSFSNTNAKTTIENCLFAGRFKRGENLTDEAFLGAFGTLRSVNAIKNCYYLGDDGLEAVHSDSNLKPGSDNVEITKATGEELKKGTVAKKLGEYWEQGVHYPTLKDHAAHWGSETYGYTDNGDGTHDKVCTGCGYVEVDNEAHTGGIATCTEQAKCERCGASYGELNPDNHASDTYTYTDNGDGTHDKVCTGCGYVEVDNEAHTIENHVCTACGAMEIVVSFDSGDYEWKTGDTLYFCRVSGDNEWEEYAFTATVAGDGTVTWTPDKTLYWDDTGKHKLVVVYPGDTPWVWDRFYVGDDQTTTEKLHEFDLMNAMWSGNPTTDPITLNLKHRLAKVTVNYEIAEGVTVSKAEVYTLTQYLLFDIHTLERKNIAWEEGHDLWINSYHNGNQFTAFVSPDAYAADGNFIKITLDNGTVYEVKMNKAVTFEEGAEYTYTVVITADGAYLTCADECTFEYTDNGDGTHDMVCTGCGYVEVDNEAHSGGTATCAEQAKCEHCGASYGEVDKNNHDETVAYVNGFCPNCDAYEPAKLVDGVYEISNAGNLYWFADKVTNENAAYGSADAILTCDIRVNEGTMTEASTGARVWTPIGKVGWIDNKRVEYPYAGTFDGQGNTVSGLYFNDTSANFSVGLFSLVGEGGKVQNVGIADSYLCGSQSIGAVAGINYGTVTGCYNTGTVSGSSYVGGVVGSNNGTVENCYNTGIISGSDNSVGGVVGSNRGTVTDCYNTGTVSGSSYYVGGVVGSNDGTVTGCYNTGTISGSSNVGGVVGDNEDTVTGCYNTGTVNGTTDVGGVVGHNWTAVTNCYNTGTVSGTTDVGGVVGTNWTAVTNCYNTGTVSGTTNIGGVVGNNIVNSTSTGTVTNCYFDSTVYTGDAIGTNNGTATKVEGKSTEQFASGEVAYLLSQGENGSIWGQDLDNGKPVQTTPTFNGAKVYCGYTSCGDTVAKYTNDETISAEKPDHTQKPTYTDNGNGTHSAVYPCCGTTVTEEHDFENDAHQCVCGYACPHDSYTDGVCDKCGYECPHEWGEGVLTRPVHDAVLGSKDGYYTYTCAVCAKEKKETVKSADYSAYEAVSEEINALLQSDELTNAAKQAIYSAANECGLLSNDLTESEQNKVDNLVAELEKIVADADEKIASGEYVKADYTAIDEAIKAVENKLTSEYVTDEGKAELEEIKTQLEEMKADGNTSKADLAELETALDEYEEELDKGIEDGTLVNFSGERVFLELAEEAEKKIDEKYGENAFYDFANENRDSFYNLYDKYFFRAASLEGGTMAENAENIEYIKEMVDELFGMAENCLAGTHNYGEGVLTRPTFESEGYYTYTCTLCGHSYTEPTEKADTTALNDAYMKVTEYIDNDTLTQEASDEIYESYRDILRDNGNIFDELGFVRGDLIEEDQPLIDAITAEFEKIIADADEKIASGEYVKAEYTEIDEAIDDIEEKLASENVTDEGKAELEEIKKQLEEMKADENTSAADVAELEKALEDYEEELDKGIEDGTLVEIDVYKIGTELSVRWTERLEAEGLLDEREDFVNNQKYTDEAVAVSEEIEEFLASLEGTVAENAENIAKLNEMFNSFTASFENCLRGTHNFNDYEVTSPAKCEVNAIETRICWFCGETDEREIEGTALTHSFTKYEETEEAKCGVAGKEVAYCDNGCQTTDERETPALEHVFGKYTSNGDATCTADGTKTAECIHGCGETDTVADEGTKLSHVDEDGDKLCDDCQYEIIDTCPDCGRPAHEDTGVPMYICIIIMFIRLVVSFVRTLQGAVA